MDVDFFDVNWDNDIYDLIFFKIFKILENENLVFKKFKD